jgi:alkanesulfonate monooxygenase SsuD/methylene tetrahydromethanopterin reductase-like flavin-dependent oxidoreductase (luciferase family)
VGTLASLARGRFILACAIGGDERQFAGVGADHSRRPSHLEAGVDIIRRLLCGETVPANGPYRVREAVVSPVPPEPVEVWVGGTAERAVDRAARLGDGFLADAHLTPHQARGVLDLYRERAAAHGRTPRALAIRRDSHVGADDLDAQRVAGPLVAAGYRGFDPSACVYAASSRWRSGSASTRPWGTRT